jgi:malate permease and related proteins
MSQILLQVVPIFFYFIVGVLLRRFGLAERSHGDFVLRLAFFVTLPLLILLTLPDAELSVHTLMLPLANIVVNVLCFATMLLVTLPLHLPRPALGALAMNTLIVNNAFMFPFMLAIYGESGFADAVLYDFGNAIMVATVTYAIAFRYSDETYRPYAMLRRIAASPLLWALGIGVALSLSGRAIPAAVVPIVEPVARMTAPLILIALGIFFSFSVRQLRLVGLSLAIRMGLGLLFGVAFAALVGLEGQAFVVVALCSAAPIGFMALTFTSMARLDTELTASAVSFSILLGLIYIPLLLLLFNSAPN